MPKWMRDVWDWVRGRGRKLAIALPVAAGAYQLTASDADMRRLRVRFPTTSTTLSASAGSVALTGKDATLSQSSALAWRAVPALSMVQGDSIQLSQYVNNPQGLTLSYVATTQAMRDTLAAANVTLLTTGLLQAASNATVGTISNVSFTATTGATPRQPLAAAPGVFALAGQSATLRKSPTGPLSMTVTPVPYTGVGGYLGMSKNLQIQRCNGVWYKVGGDHISLGGNTPTGQDGRQEIFAIDFANNTWTLAQPYFLRTGTSSSTVQTALPDDPSAAVVGNEIWIVANETANTTGGSNDALTASVRSEFGPDVVYQDFYDIMAWNPATGIHRVITARQQLLRGDRGWMSYYDAPHNRIITPLTSAFFIIDGTTGADVTPYFGTPPTQLQDYGAVDFHAAGIPVDQSTNNAYVYDQTHGALYRFSLASASNQFTLVKVLDLPQCTYVSAGRGIHINWHAGIRAIIISDVARQIFAYQVDTGTLSSWSRLDGWTNGIGVYVAPAFECYDPVTGDLFTIGGIDWDTGMVSTVYWRLHFQ